MRITLTRWHLATLLPFFIFLHTTTKAQVPKGDRTLAWQVDMAENMNYDSAYSYALDGCMESIHLFFPWSSIEPTAGTFDAAYIAQTLDIIDIYHPAFGIKAELQLAPINTTQREVPADLANVSWDSPQMISRFKTFLDTIFAHIPNLELAALNIGNESDIYFANDLSQYATFTTFLDSITPYAKQLYFNLHGSDLKVGTTLTHEGLTSILSYNFCQGLVANRDILSVTYYPLDYDYSMKPPSTVAGDFSALVTLFPDTAQPIYFVECGYASSDSISSEALQAQFYQNVFTEWDAHYDRIKYLTIFKTNDWSQAEVDTLVSYYGLIDPNFREYLLTLGVRTWDGNGTAKLAYDVINCELDARGWCQTNCVGVGVDEAVVQDLEVYPNPAVERVAVSSGKRISEVEIYDQMGKMVRTSGPGRYIDVSSLPAGMYHVRVKYANGMQESKPLLKASGF